MHSAIPCHVGRKTKYKLSPPCKTAENMASYFFSIIYNLNQKKFQNKNIPTQNCFRKYFNELDNIFNFFGKIEFYRKNNLFFKTQNFWHVLMHNNITRQLVNYLKCIVYFICIFYTLSI